MSMQIIEELWEDVGWHQLNRETMPELKEILTAGEITDIKRIVPTNRSEKQIKTSFRQFNEDQSKLIATNWGLLSIRINNKDCGFGCQKDHLKIYYHKDLSEEILRSMVENGSFLGTLIFSSALNPDLGDENLKKLIGERIVEVNLCQLAPMIRPAHLAMERLGAIRIKTQGGLHFFLGVWLGAEAETQDLCLLPPEYVAKDRVESDL